MCDAGRMSQVAIQFTEDRTREVPCAVHSFKGTDTGRVELKAPSVSTAMCQRSRQ